MVVPTPGEEGGEATKKKGRNSLWGGKKIKRGKEGGLVLSGGNQGEGGGGGD